MNDRKKVQYIGEEGSIYRGADEILSVSLTCSPGDVVMVSNEKAAELLEDTKNWRVWTPKKAPGSPGVPAGRGGQPAGSALHSGNQFAGDKPDPAAVNQGTQDKPDPNAEAKAIADKAAAEKADADAKAKADEAAKTAAKK